MSKILNILFLIPLCCLTQNYNGPESVEYNAVTGSYFISNSSNGQILELDSNNNLSIFTSNIGSGPHGLEIVDNILYACSGGRLKGYDLDNGNQVLNFNVGGTFLNGITHYIDGSGSYLFITDFTARKLYRYRIEDQWISSICDFPKNPNGVFLDPMYNNLYVVTWGNNAPIYEVDFTTEEFYTATTTDLNNLDGISMDECGNFLISAWSTNSIHRFSNDFSESDIVVDGLSYPADIIYDQLNNFIVIPNSGNNTVEFVPYSPFNEPTALSWWCNDNTDVIEYKKNIQIIKTIDLLGRETKSKGFNIEIYEDGSVNKNYKL